jgi:hypothetical protein
LPVDVDATDALLVRPLVVTLIASLTMPLIQTLRSCTPRRMLLVSHAWLSVEVVVDHRAGGVIVAQFCTVEGA